MALMNRMRENTKNILLILVFAFIATIIFDWGMGGFKGKQPQGVIAKVDGQEILVKEYNTQLQNELKTYRDQSGKDAEGYMLQRLQDQVFERLVQQRLMAKVIKDKNLMATNAEVVEEIFNNPPEFLRNNEALLDSSGQFSIEKYHMALNNPSADWRPIEDYMRSTLPYQKLDNLIRSVAVATDEDARLEYYRTKLKAKVRYLFYDASKYADAVAEPTDEEIKAYYEKNKDTYQEPEKRKIDYVLIPLVPSKADSEATLHQAQDIYEEAVEGSDFAELARLYSQDPGSAEKGGDLGYFSKERMVTPFSDAVFAANKGDILGPIETQFGLHVIKVIDKKREKGEMQVKASHVLLKYEVSPATREKTRDEATYISEMAKEGDFEAIVKNEGYELKNSPEFTKDSFIAGIGMEKSINLFSFKNKVGKVSDVINLSDRGYVVFKIAEAIKEQILPLDKVKTRLVASLKSEKRMEAAQLACQKAYDKLSNGKAIDEIAEQDSLDIKETEPFSMTANIQGVGNEPQFVGTAFGLETSDTSKPIEGKRGYYIIQVISRNKFNEKEFEAQKESLKLSVLARRRQQLYGKWYAALKEKADIKDYREDYLM